MPWTDAPDTFLELARENYFGEHPDRGPDIRLAPNTYSNPAPGRKAVWTDNGDGVRRFVGYIDVAGEENAKRQRAAAAERKAASAKYRQREERRAIDRAISEHVWRWRQREKRRLAAVLREQGQPVPSDLYWQLQKIGIQRQQKLTRRVNRILKQRASNFAP